MLKVTIHHSPAPRLVWEEELSLPQGVRVLEALLSLKQSDSSFFMDFNESDTTEVCLKPGYQVAIWSKPVGMDHVLRDLDRIEVLRPIKVDPKVARRERFKKQGSKGAKGAGLFAKQRPGAKAGY